MKLGKRSFLALNRGLVRYAILSLVFTIVPSACLSAKSDVQKVMIGVGYTEIIELSSAVKRISIANPDIADASVTTPTQLVINGKSLGATSMIVWDDREKYKKFKLVVHSENSYHQVMLRVRFAEVNRTAFKELGFDFLIKNMKAGSDKVDVGSFSGHVNTPSDPLSLGDNVDFFLAIPTQNVSTIIKALEEKRLLTMLASPSLSALNGAEASFLAGGEIPVPIVSGIANQVTIEYKEFGIRLKFVPTVLDSELVNISVSTEVSSLDFDNGIVLSGFRIPALTSRKTETAVELRDGEIFAIGGLVTNEIAHTISRIPLLGNIPVLGKLFSSERFLDSETELVVMISPHIVQPMKRDSSF